MKLYNRTLKQIETRRDRILSGKINSIPWGLPRFENELPGIEQSRYYLISANSKVNLNTI